MILGNYIVIACPKCGFFYKYRTLKSYSSFNANHWSDGKKEFLRYPIEDAVAFRCRECHSLFLVKDAKKIGEMPPFFENDKSHIEGSLESKNIQTIPRLTISDFIDAINDPLFLSQGEEYLRIGLWHAINDLIRKGHAEEINQEYRNLFKENLNKLIPLLRGDSPGEILLRAEANREAGNFEIAKILLRPILDFGSTAKKIYALAKKKDSKVIKVG
jgi:DNA-directed RNA polymerase subunit RPC12/RpoP